MHENDPSGSCTVALVGPYLSGKTTLLESLLYVTGATSRKGRIQDGNTVGDSAPEARERQMSVEVSAASTVFEGRYFTFLDCPGSVEFAQEMYNALVGVDAAVVVCEPDPERVLLLAPLFKFLDDWSVPHLLFINKLDRADGNLRGVLQALRSVCSRPLVLQQYPITGASGPVGFIDLVTEQAYQYRPGASAVPVPLPEPLREEEHRARIEMLETLADFDDHLLEELLEETEPPRAEILHDLQNELAEDLIVPVFLGMADQDFGVRPLLGALVAEAPESRTTTLRRGIDPESFLAQVLKTYLTPQGGKLSLVRVWGSVLEDGSTLDGVRIGGIYRLSGAQQTALPRAQAGDVVALARLEGVKTGDTLGRTSAPLPTAERLSPVFGLAISSEKRSDEVKLSTALAKLLEEDPALAWEQEPDTREVLLWGQGEIHLQVTLDRLKRKYNLPLVSRTPQVPYKETIRKTTNSHGRYKHQTGGHGQFGDVYLDLQPLPRGSGFRFAETIVGGAVPRQYIPGVEVGVREFLEQGPLGYPVVDLAVTLTHGSFHTVDSSEQAFKQAARIAMQEGLPRCEPVLLEPILGVEIAVPNAFTASVLRLLTGRRGQILGYEPKPNWNGWDTVIAHLPQAQMQDFIVELRSLTLGVGFFRWHYDHLQEVPEKRGETMAVGHRSTATGRPR
ncbi:elongation factor G [Anthocerotibacter panamensis]|uniref:elongation factor G n=1 Tax=Anthocerotibacter panamensis TaxID=2857077 RepID=UPI001C401E99|nr:elongation factor G [Anthocerotibacter panamensis]